MAETTLQAEPGRATGSAAARRLRAEGRIPGIVYGHGVEPAPVSVDARELRHALTGPSGVNELLTLEVGSERHLTLARVLQRHPVRGSVVHVDFQVVSRDEIVAAEVPVVLVGTARAVELEHGVVEHPLTSITLQARPGSIPNAIEVDVSELAVGEAIRVGQLRLPPGVTTEVDPEEPVVLAAASEMEGEMAELDAEAARAGAASGVEAASASADDEG